MDSGFALKLEADRKSLLMAGQMLQAETWVRTEFAFVQELMAGQMLLFEEVRQTLVPQLPDQVRRKDLMT
jgi:hypothetical protein